jgi:hypothetical protein
VSASSGITDANATEREKRDSRNLVLNWRRRFQNMENDLKRSRIESS